MGGAERHNALSQWRGKATAAHSHFRDRETVARLSHERWPCWAKTCPISRYNLAATKMPF
jgi:hypothetical protein